MHRPILPFVSLLLGVILPCAAQAQQNETVVEARVAFDNFEYQRAVDLAQAALGEPLSEEEMADAYEVLGYSYGILDDADQAVSTLTQMIVLDPDRVPDRQNLPPRISGLYDQAFDQVLVVRGILVDSIGFVSGEGRVTLHYEVSRPASATLRVIGNGVDAVIDSAVVNPGPSRFDWNAMVEDQPLPAGEYQLLVTAAEGRNQYQRLGQFTVQHTVVDTVAHQLSLESEGIVKQPETEIPPRDWRPLGVATLLTGAATGAALALSNATFDGGGMQLSIGAGLSLGTGLWLSLRQPEPRPVQLAIEFNQLVDQMLDDRNARIAADNAERRRRVRLTIVQVVQ